MSIGRVGMLAAQHQTLAKTGARRLPPRRPRTDRVGPPAPHALPSPPQAKLREFLALMPAEQREAAATQVASSPF